jgi:hypothetical protein
MLQNIPGPLASQSVWLFRCANRPTLHGDTLDSSGGKLPTRPDQDGPWTQIGQLTVGPDDTARTGIDITAIKTGIEADAYISGIQTWIFRRHLCALCDEGLVTAITAPACGRCALNRSSYIIG